MVSGFTRAVDSFKGVPVGTPHSLPAPAGKPEEGEQLNPGPLDSPCETTYFKQDV